MTDRTERAPSAFRLNLEQQKNRAKDLLRDAKAGNTQAISRLAAVRRDSIATLKLADGVKHDVAQDGQAPAPSCHPLYSPGGARRH